MVVVDEQLRRTPWRRDHRGNCLLYWPQFHQYLTTNSKEWQGKAWHRKEQQRLDWYSCQQVWVQKALIQHKQERKKASGNVHGSRFKVQGQHQDQHGSGRKYSVHPRAWMNPLLPSPKGGVILTYVSHWTCNHHKLLTRNGQYLQTATLLCAVSSRLASSSIWSVTSIQPVTGQKGPGATRSNKEWQGMARNGSTTGAMGGLASKQLSKNLCINKVLNNPKIGNWLKQLKLFKYGETVQETTMPE